MIGSKDFKDKKLRDFIKKFGIDDATNFICQLSQEQFDNIVAFTKEDLKPGMVVEFRNGRFGMVFQTINGLVLSTKNNEEYLSVDGLQENLICDGIFHDHDIAKVYGYSRYGHTAANISKDNRELLWERKEPKKMTIEKAKRLLEELTGEDIELVERIRKDRIVVGENVFTDINKAIAYLKSLSDLKQFDTE